MIFACVRAQSDLETAPRVWTGGQRDRAVQSRIGADVCLLDSPGHWLLKFFASDFFSPTPSP